MGAVPDALAQQPSREGERLMAEFGLRESPAPVSSQPRWRAPQKIIVDTGVPGLLEALRTQAPGVQFVGAGSPDSAAAVATGADAVIGRSAFICDERLLAAGKDLRWLQTVYAGVEACAVRATVLRKRQIIVTNLRAISAPVIAEHVIAFTFALSRGLYAWVPLREQRLWAADSSRAPMSVISGKTMLIVGLGGIGSEVAKRANALGMRVIATRATPQQKPSKMSKTEPRPPAKPPRPTSSSLPSLRCSSARSASRSATPRHLPPPPPALSATRFPSANKPLGRSTKPAAANNCSVPRLTPPASEATKPKPSASSKSKRGPPSKPNSPSSQAPPPLQTPESVYGKVLKTPVTNFKTYVSETSTFSAQKNSSEHLIGHAQQPVTKPAELELCSQPQERSRIELETSKPSLTSDVKRDASKKKCKTSIVPRKLTASLFSQIRLLLTQ